MMNQKLFLTICFLLSIIVNSCQALVKEEELSAWKEFKETFGKNYSDNDEDQRRMLIFLANREFVLESQLTRATTTSTTTTTTTTTTTKCNRLMRECNDSELSFTQGLNELSDLTQDEINKSRNGFRIQQVEDLVPTSYEDDEDFLRSFVNETSAQTIADRGWLENLLSPAYLDYRQKGRVSKVKNQGSCGSCWSFATTGALESMLAARGQNVLLSEQNLIDCSRRYGNHGCNGGLMNQALNYVRDHGIMSEIDYPYTGKDESCKFLKSKSITTIRGNRVLSNGNEHLLRIALALRGPIPIAIDAGAKSFHSYKSGVYNDRSSCKNTMSHLNHAVLLVGYGTDRNHGEYWIIKNSWGKTWGEDGYIKMARNSRNLCGVATFAVIPLP